MPGCSSGPRKVDSREEKLCCVARGGGLCFSFERFVPFSAVLLGFFPNYFSSSYRDILQKEEAASKLNSLCEVPQIALIFLFILDSVVLPFLGQVL